MFKAYLIEEKRKLVLNIITKVVGTLFEISLPAILAFIIDSIVPKKDLKEIVMWGILMIVFAIIGWLLNILANRMSADVSTSIIFRLRQDLFVKSMNLSSRQIDKLSMSSLESRMTSDTYTIHQLLGGVLRMGVRIIIMFMGGVIFCFSLSPKLSLILIFLILPIMVSVRIIFKNSISLFRSVQNKLDDMVQVIRETIRGIRVIKAFNKTTYEKSRYKEADEIYKATEIQAQDRMAAVRPIVDSILYSGLAAVLILGSTMVASGEIQTGVIIAFLSYFIQITFSIIGLNYMFNMFNRASASWDRIERVLSQPVDSSQIEKTKPRDLPRQDLAVPEIEFRNVSFSYLGQTNNLEDISFKIYPGQTLGIMGPTGSGKSTVIRLMLRQYDVSQGEVLIRGVNIKDLRIKDIKDLFGMAFQDDFLYSGSIRDNINFGRIIEDDKLSLATAHAQADEFISGKESGLDFRLASKGVNLSGGQKQRLIISRALASNPEILILDDSTSALDFKTESKVRRSLEETYECTTSIIIAQRTSAIAHAEQILFLDEGRALALGSHEDLMKTCGPYREIAEMQRGE